jgi:amidophosphoribosyltransferase
MARDSGANRVFFASASPPVRFPNVYGIDMPSAKELIANGRNDAEIAREIGADRLIYQDLDALEAACRSVNPRVTSFETSCFSGKYVTGDVTPEYLANVEAQRNDGEIRRRQEIVSTQLDLNLATND